MHTHTHWRTQRRIHGIYKRRPHTQHKPDTSTFWWKSRVGPKSGGPAQSSNRTTSFAAGLGEVRVPPGPPTGGGPNNGSKPRPSQGGKMAGGATQHRITAQGSTETPRHDSPRHSPTMAQQLGHVGKGADATAPCSHSAGPTQHQTRQKGRGPRPPLPPLAIHGSPGWHAMEADPSRSKRSY